VRLALFVLALLLAGPRATLAGKSGERKTYRDPNCAIELQYPSRYHLQATSAPESCALWILLRDAAGPETAWLYDLSVEEMNQADRQEMTRAGGELTAQRFALWKAELHCAADGADTSTYCTAARVRATFKTKQGSPGFEIEMTEVNESYGEGDKPEVEKRMRGPVYALDISDDETVRVLFAERLGTARPETLRAIVETLRIVGKARRLMPRVIPLDSPGRLLVPHIAVPPEPK